MHTPEHQEEWEIPAELETKLPELEVSFCDIGEVVLHMRENGLTAVQKSHNPTDFVTEADKLSEHMLSKAIHELFPDHSIEGEEGTDMKGLSGYQWYLDPIDGTKPCKEGRSFGISAGLSHDGQPIVGMIYYPVEEKMLKAMHGEGATVNGQPLKSAKEVTALVGASIGFDHSSSGDHEDQRVRFRVPLEEHGATAENYWCATKAVLDVMEGRKAAYVCSGATPYDIAAAVVIAEEAGCAYAPIEGSIDLTQKFTPIVFAQTPELLNEILGLYK